MKVQKKNSIEFPKELNIIEYNPKTNTLNQNINSNNSINKTISSNNNNYLYIKSKYNIQKKTNEPINYLDYMKYHPCNKSIQNKIKLSNKNKNNNISVPEIRTDKNEDTISTVPLTKEFLENRKSLSCKKRNINKDMVFVKKKIQANLKNSFTLNESPRNNSCLCIGNGNSRNTYNGRLNNSVNNNGEDYLNNKNFMCKNIWNSFDNEMLNNNVLITNNNINLITNNNYINNDIREPKKNSDIMKINTKKVTLRMNNSVELRRNKKTINNNIDTELKEINHYAPPFSPNLKNYNGSKSIKRRNIINYFDNFNLLNSESESNKNKNKLDLNFPSSSNRINNLLREKKMEIKKKNIIFNNMNNINCIKNNNAKNITNNSKLNEAKLIGLNYEDLYLILKKFEIIKNNLILFENLKHPSNKQLLENINMTRIFIYDLYKFYLNSSFEGCPQNLFNDKNAELYLHFYSIVLIISLGLIYIITQKIKTTKNFINNILFLMDILHNGFLFFCDSIFEYYVDKEINNDMWIDEIMHELNNVKIPYGMDHILYIKKVGIDGYKLFNKIIKNMIDYNNYKIDGQELFLYRNFWNKSINYLSQIKIHNLEETFDKNIFRIINLNINFDNITSIKTTQPPKNRNIHLLNQSNTFNINVQMSKSKKRSEITSLLFRNENIHNINLKTSYKNSTANKFGQYQNFSNKYKTKNKIPLIEIIKNPNNNINKNTKQPHGGYKNLIKTLTIKEPYLNFPPSKEYTLVLDLDETMINFQFIYPEKGIGQMHLRPGLENFLELIKEFYEIIVFTSGTREYADMILDVIEHKKQKKFFDGRLYREHTTRIGNKYIKDLSKIGRDLSRTLIVDNLPHSFKFQHENGILISSYYGDKKNMKEDKALIELQKILIKIYEEKNDVRKSIMKFKEEIIKNVSCLDLDKSEQNHCNNSKANTLKDISCYNIYS